MMDVELTNKAAVLFGLRGSGKSTLLRYIAGKYGKRAFIYDTINDIPADSSIHAYKPRDSYSLPEMELVISRAIRSNIYNLIAIDEANRYCPSKPVPMPLEIAHANDLFRHKEYGYRGNLTMLYIARRPVQLNQDLTELSDWLFIFRLSGRNDRMYLNGLSDGLGDAVAALPDYHFYAVDSQRNYKLCSPVKIN